MKLYFEKRVVLGFVIALAILVWLHSRPIHNNQKFVEINKRVSHTKVLYLATDVILPTSIEIVRVSVDLSSEILAFRAVLKDNDS